MRTLSVLLLFSVSFLAAANGSKGQQFEDLSKSVSPYNQRPLYQGVGTLDNYQDMKKYLSVNHGLDYQIQIAPIGQTHGHGNNYLDNETDLIIQKRFWENPNGYGKLVFAGVMVNMLNNTDTRKFADDVGLGPSQPNGGMTGSDQNITAINGLWWEHSLLNRQLTYRLGHLYTTRLWATNKYLSDDRSTFMASPFSHQGLSWTTGQRALGATLSVQNDWAYAQVGFNDAKPNGKDIDFRSFSDGKMVRHIELGLTPQFNFGGGEFKVSVADIDDTSSPQTSANDLEANRAGQTLSISVSQDFGNVGVFARYNRSYQRYVAKTKAVAVGGIVFNDLLDNQDVLGIGYAEVEPIDRIRKQHGNEKSIEIYYDFKVTNRLSIAPDIQHYFTKSATRGINTAGDTIIGLRLRYML
ncbi:MULTISPECIES: carbohydrate porin [unclassified Agarivorans]|nr:MULTISPECIES: carbohydrate porin [unclassified Agarivorans]MDO6684815.1 carbohydrate porin [Agarivorans sp. 3_MG-2023]MDO6715024.1 carbohydrate porin [Agarivorans sp. 2_MG-2023]